MFAKKNNTVDIDKKRIYEPEDEIYKKYPYSGWRKPLAVYSTNTHAKYKMLDIEFGSLKFFDVINIILCILIFFFVLQLVFLTTYEKTILVDGTELSCILKEDGTIEPYQPPKAPSVPMPKTSWIKH